MVVQTTPLKLTSGLALSLAQNVPPPCQPAGLLPLPQTPLSPLAPPSAVIVMVLWLCGRSGEFRELVDAPFAVMDNLPVTRSAPTFCVPT